MRAFSEIGYYDFISNRTQTIASEIIAKGKDYLLKVDEEEYIKYMVDKYTVEPLHVASESEPIGPPRIIKRSVSGWRGEYYVDYYSFNISYRFSGSPILFQVQSNPRTLSSYDISVNERAMLVSYQIEVEEKSVEAFNQAKMSAYSRAFTNLTNINNNINEINGNLENHIRTVFNREKTKYLQENDFFAAINIKVNPDTELVFNVPTIRKVEIPQPTLSKTKEYSSEPTISKKLYQDIIEIVYNTGRNIEKKPSLYQGKDEEALRDQFLLFLETRYEATTASGETFNRGGKTDILLKYAKDGSNLFVAECKFWHGSAEFLKAISQLFDRYLTWRDSKVALMMFVKQSGFSGVLDGVMDL